MHIDHHLQCRLELTALAAIAVLLWAPGARAQAGLGLTPMREELRLAAGAPHSGALTLTNDSRETVRVSGEILDFFLDSTATPQFVPRAPREAEFSCRSWLTVNPMELELGGGEQVTVRYTVRTPASASERSYHCAIAFTTKPTASQVAGTGIRTAVQVVASLYVVVGKPAAEGTLKSLKLEYVPDRKKPGWRAVVVFANPSLMHYRPTGDLEVLDQNGKVVERSKFIPLPVLPKRDQTFLFPLTLASGPGAYLLRVRVDIGGDYIQEGTARVVAERPSP